MTKDGSNGLVGEKLRYSRRQLIDQGTLSKGDLYEIARCRRNHNRLGFAYQIGFVRLNNRFPIQSPFELIDELLQYISTQMGIDPSEIHQYTIRQPTISEHQNSIRRYLNLKEFVDSDTEPLKKFIFDQSCRLEQTGALLSLVKQYLQDHRILKPAESTLSRLVGEQRSLAQQFIYGKIADSLSDETLQKLNNLLDVDEETFSAIQQLKAVPRKPSPSALIELTYKLEQILNTGILDIDLSWLNNNYQRALTNYIQRCSAYRIRELTPHHRYAAIACFLRQTYSDTIDQIIDMYDKLINKVYRWAQDDLDKVLKQKRRSIQKSLSMFTTVGEILLDNTVSDSNVREVLFRMLSPDDLAEQLEQSKELSTGKNSHLFHGIIRRFIYLRQFSKALLEYLHFESHQGETNSLLEAVEVLKGMNGEGKRKLPPEAPIDFIPTKLRPFILNGGELDKRAWECALLTVLRDEIKSGNIYVNSSKRFRNFDDFFIPITEWQKIRKSFFEASDLPIDPEMARVYLTKRLNMAFDRFLESQPSNAYVKLDSDGWRLSVDPAEKLAPQEEDNLEQLKGWLGKQMRSIRLPELLIEVDNELNYTQHFMPVPVRDKRSVPDVCAVLAAIMANGCNVGPYTMSQLIKEVSYGQIQRITDWQLTEENQRSALASVVNAIANLDISQIWGQGKTSSSDGQRFAFRRQVLHQTYSHKFSDFALEFYSYIADNYALFYSIPVECTDRDAPYVLDGLLYNESDLELEEHYTDTHGYTEINFAAFAMLGRRFCPRIRSVHRQRIYRIDTEKDYGVLMPLVQRSDRIIKMDRALEQWDRMGQFYATLQSGHTTANVALKRLNAMSSKNHFYQANRELGRIFKTEFILQYMSQPSLRRRIRRGLLKTEQLHALARDVAYGKRGRMTERDFHAMMKTCSCLALILACIIYWQAKEIGRTITDGNPEEDGIDISLLEHVSPIGWENVVLYGEYVIDPSLIR
ncbi:Tn3 family transposase [Candidatus Poribacteria bacterium]